MSINLGLSKVFAATSAVSRLLLCCSGLKRCEVSAIFPLSVEVGFRSRGFPLDHVLGDDDATVGDEVVEGTGQHTVIGQRTELAGLLVRLTLARQSLVAEVAVPLVILLVVLEHL